MTFNSFAFAVFVPVVLALHFALPHRLRWVLQLVASYVFYLWWRLDYGLLLLFSTYLDWWVSNRLGRTEGVGARKALLGVSLVGNLGLLFAFKYYNLFNDVGRRAVGVDWPLPPSDLILPVGISFYTFQTLSYAIDVYRRDIQPEPNFFRFALFVSYWPQLVAGPIERAGRLLPQLFVPRPWDSERAASGLRLALWGMFKKVVVADRLGPIADAIYADPANVSGPAVVIGTVCFGWQIWCDFSGYSDIAIGCARVMGVDLMKNFDQPHLASSVTDYWRRWHLSLTTWFTDYVYKPLGGSRGGLLSKYRNIVFVFVLSGLWHGANWSIVMWGLSNGLLLVVDEVTRPARLAFYGLTRLDRFPKLLHAMCVVGTLPIMYLTYPFFRSPDLGAWWKLVRNLPDGWGTGRAMAFFERIDMMPWFFVATMSLIVIVEIGEYLHRDEHVAAWTARQPPAVRGARDLLLIVAVLFAGSWTAQPFFYFQF